MKSLFDLDDVWYYHNPKAEEAGEPNPRLWHACKRYRNLEAKNPVEREARVEIFEVERTDEVIRYKCQYCDFEYELKVGAVKKLLISRA